MYEDRFPLSDSEMRQVREILGDMSLRGGALADATGRPVRYRVLQGRRYLVCERGLVWRYAPTGTPHVPGQAGGATRRNSAVEMWTGRWRKVRTPDGRETYAKCLVWVPVEENINGHAGLSKRPATAAREPGPAALTSASRSTSRRVCDASLDALAGY